MFDDNKKYFPIKTETACVKKWNWSTIFLNTGRTNSCHRCDSLPVDINNFGDFHNLPKKLEDRKHMLAGEWPVGGCEYCQNLEAAGKGSDRTYHTSIPNLVPPELIEDPTSIRVTPQIVEAYLNNTCNLACVYCHEEFSSKIQQENRKFGAFDENGVTIVPSNRFATSANYFDKFYIWLEENSTKIKRLHLEGGETFYQKEMDVVIDILRRHPNKDLQVNVVSNMMAKKTQHYIEEFKKLCKDRCISRFDLTASIDCWGPQAEYIRYGLKLDEWESNFSYAAKQKWLTLNTNIVMNVLSIKTTPDLIERINKYAQERKINQQFNLVVGDKKYLHPKIFGGEMWREDFEKIITLYPDADPIKLQQKQYLIGIWEYLKSCEKDVTLIKQLHTYLDEIDRRRNTNWRELFPYLDYVV